MTDQMRTISAETQIAGSHMIGTKEVRRVDILGCPFDAITLEETLDAVETTVRNGGHLQVVPGNVDFVMKARRDPVFARELQEADLVVADGNFVAWASQILRTPLKGRVSGTELVWQCGGISARTGCGVAMIGSAEGIADRAAEKMRAYFPGSRVEALPTPYPLTEEGNRELVKRIRAMDAGIVLVALGAPRQERWVQSSLADSGAAVGIGIGSAFDIISGDKPRAPMWMQRMSLEWFYRMILEPRRLGRRYLIEDMPFVAHLFREALRRWL